MKVLDNARLSKDVMMTNRESFLSFVWPLGLHRMFASDVDWLETRRGDSMQKAYLLEHDQRMWPYTTSQCMMESVTEL